MKEVKMKLFFAYPAAEDESDSVELLLLYPPLGGLCVCVFVLYMPSLW